MLCKGTLLGDVSGYGVRRVLIPLHVSSTVDVEEYNKLIIKQEFVH